GIAEYLLGYWAMAVLFLSLMFWIRLAGTGAILTWKAGAILIGTILAYIVPIVTVRTWSRSRWRYVMTLAEDGLRFTRRGASRSESRIWQWKTLRSVSSWPRRFGSPCLRIIHDGRFAFLSGGLFIDLDLLPTQTEIVEEQIRRRIDDHRRRNN